MSEIATAIREYVGRAEVARMLKRNPKAVGLLVGNTIPYPIKVGRKLLWRREAILEALDRLEREAQAAGEGARNAAS